MESWIAGIDIDITDQQLFLAKLEDRIRDRSVENYIKYLYYKEDIIINIGWDLLSYYKDDDLYEETEDLVKEFSILQDAERYLVRELFK